ncbi:MAG: DUF4405 domain-containing protein [Pseudomonadota bacterium]
MSIKYFRNWITPLVAGGFMLLSVTGVLMFFHLDSGLNKAAHEWLSWLFVAGVGLHIVLHSASFKRHLHTLAGRIALVGFVVLLILSFAPLGGSSKPPFIAPIQAMANAPLPVLAQVAGVDLAELDARLAKRGIKVQRPEQSIRELVGPDLGEQMRALSVVAQQ